LNLRNLPEKPVKNGFPEGKGNTNGRD